MCCVYVGVCESENTMKCTEHSCVKMSLHTYTKFQVFCSCFSAFAADYIEIRA